MGARHLGHEDYHGRLNWRYESRRFGSLWGAMEDTTLGEYMI